jgi:hypothetical protein
MMDIAKHVAIFLLDRSGSMGTIKVSTIENFNAYIEEIKPLKGRGFKKRQRPRIRRASIGTPGLCNPPGKVEQIGGAEIFQDKVHLRITRENLAKAEPHRNDHQRKPDNDACDVRQGAHEAESRTGSRQHDIVRSRRSGGDKTEQGDGENCVDHVLKNTEMLFGATIERDLHGSYATDASMHYQAAEKQSK